MSDYTISLPDSTEHHGAERPSPRGFPTIYMVVLRQNPELSAVLRTLPPPSRVMAIFMSEVEADDYIRWHPGQQYAVGSIAPPWVLDCISLDLPWATASPTHS